MKIIISTFLFTGLLFNTKAQSYSTTRSELPLRIHFAPIQNKEQTYPKRLWLDISGQMAYIGNSAGIAAGGNLHYLNRSYRHFQISYNYIEDVKILNSSPQYSVSDIGYKIGWLRSRKFSLMEFAIGVSCVTGYKRGDEDQSNYWGLSYKHHYFTTIGAGFEADIKLMARRYAGIGLVIKGNLNPEASYISGGIELTMNGPN